MSNQIAAFFCSCSGIMHFVMLYQERLYRPPLGVKNHNQDTPLRRWRPVGIYKGPTVDYPFRRMFGVEEAKIPQPYVQLSRPMCYSEQCGRERGPMIVGLSRNCERCFR